MINFDSEFGIRAERRLYDEQIIWLTTVDRKGSPQPRPVWFLWDGETILIFSRQQGHKVRHINDNPYVSLNLDSDGMGGDIIVLLGEAHIEQIPISRNQVERFIEKYTQGLERLGSSAEEFKNTYSVAIRITPTNLRGH
jgi:PPOX class probable F420-dependent enzyme